jgi:hypothetical protein
LKGFELSFEMATHMIVPARKCETRGCGFRLAEGTEKEQVQDIQSPARLQGAKAVLMGRRAGIRNLSVGRVTLDQRSLLDAIQILERGVGRGNKAYQLADHQAGSRSS